MALTRDQLNTYDANSQNEFVLRAADGGSGVVERATSLYYFLHLPYTAGLVSSEQMNSMESKKNGYIQQGARTVVQQLVEHVPVAKDIIEAIEEFIGGAVDYVTNALGIQTDRQKVINGFKQSAKSIENTLDDIQGVDKDLLTDGVFKGLRDAGSSISALQDQLKEEAKDAVGKVTGQKQSKADEVAASAAASTYQRVYKNLVDDFRDKNPGQTGEAFDAARRKAHETAARVAGVYMKEDGTFEPAKDGDGHYYGMFGFVHEGIKQVEDGKGVSTTFRLAPSDEVTRAATREPASPTPDDGITSPIAPNINHEKVPEIAK